MAHNKRSEAISRTVIHDQKKKLFEDQMVILFLHFIARFSSSKFLFISCLTIFLRDC